MTQPRTRQRDKLAPDPGVRRAILAAASKSIREQGVRGLSIAAVLDRAQLSTRAFYRHFESKDQLVAAVFLEMARVEMRRLQAKDGECRDCRRRGGGVDRRATRPGLRREHQVRSALPVVGGPITDVRLPQPGSARICGDARAAHRSSFSAAWSAASSTTSIRSPPHSRSRAWCGRAPNGNGPQAIAIALTLANASCASACAGSGWPADRRSLSEHH